MPFMLDLLRTDPQYFLMVVVVVVISIVLHELAHGWMAIRLGDDTPLRTGHMTGNPLVHMGPFSLLALCLCGIAWGQMPVDSTRVRGRHGAALVAAAGPATNLALALVTLTALGILMRYGHTLPSTGDSGTEAGVTDNLGKLLFIFGSTNILLCVFNLMPVPPLDGSRIAAHYHRGYAMFFEDPSKQGFLLMAFCAVFFLSRHIFAPILSVALDYVYWIAGT